jgi:hypothetical protein
MAYWMMHNVNYKFRVCTDVYGKVVLSGLFVDLLKQHLFSIDACVLHGWRVILYVIAHKIHRDTWHVIHPMQIQ